jgi:hypothetical protein
MKIRPLVSLITAIFAAGLMIYYSPILHQLDPELFRPENCQRCAHTIVFSALILEAVAIWIHASGEEKSAMLKCVASMFGFSGVLGLSSIVIEMAPAVTPLT